MPCIDGNCMDKSYQMDEDMVSSVAQLGALSQGKNTQAGFKIFEGLGATAPRSQLAIKIAAVLIQRLG